MINVDDLKILITYTDLSGQTEQIYVYTEKDSYHYVYSQNLFCSEKHKRCERRGPLKLTFLVKITRLQFVISDIVVSVSNIGKLCLYTDTFWETGNLIFMCWEMCQ